MKPKSRRLISVPLVLSLSLAVLGQYYLAQKRAFVWDGILLYVAAMLLFGLVVTRCEGRSRDGGGVGRASLWTEVWQLLGRSLPRLAVLLVGVGCVVWVTAVSRSRPAEVEEPCWHLLALWIA